MEVCLIDVAVIMAVPTALTVIMTDVVVVTQAGEVSGLGQAAPEQDQVTPAPESFVVVTLMVIFWPLSIDSAGPAGKLITTAAGTAPWPWHPPKMMAARIANGIAARQDRWAHPKRARAMLRRRIRT